MEKALGMTDFDSTANPQPSHGIKLQGLAGLEIGQKTSPSPD